MVSNSPWTTGIGEFARYNHTRSMFLNSRIKQYLNISLIKLFLRSSSPIGKKLWNCKFVNNENFICRFQSSTILFISFLDQIMARTCWYGANNVESTGHILPRYFQTKSHKIYVIFGDKGKSIEWVHCNVHSVMFTPWLMWIALWKYIESFFRHGDRSHLHLAGHSYPRIS